MCEVGDSIKIQASTVHHAVALMDTYFSKVNDVQRSETSKKKLQLTGFTCIFISSKMLEKDSRGPTAHDIAYLSMKSFTESQIIRAEGEILNVCNWNLSICSPIDFVKTYLNLGVLFSDD
jgi:hypothetical protein